MCPDLNSSLDEAVMQDLSEVVKLGLCIFPSPPAEISPSIRKGSVKYPAQLAAD